MKKAAPILASASFVVLLVQTLLSVLGAGIGLSLFFIGKDEAMVNAGLVAGIVLGIFTVLSLLGLILVVVGRARILDERKSGPTLLLASGILALCPVALAAGILYKRLEKDSR